MFEPFSNWSRRGKKSYYTEEQRRAIEQRDNYTCQVPHFRNPFRKGVLQQPELDGRPGENVHHETPIMVALLWKWADEQINSPYNLINTCKYCHVGVDTVTHRLADPRRRFVIHEDQIEALRQHRRGDKQAFFKMGAQRLAMFRNGQIYWNNERDELMFEISPRNTERAQQMGWTFPERSSFRGQEPNSFYTVPELLEQIQILEKRQQELIQRRQDLKQKKRWEQIEENLVWVTNKIQELKEVEIPQIQIDDEARAYLISQFSAIALLAEPRFE